MYTNLKIIFNLTVVILILTVNGCSNSPKKTSSTQTIGAYQVTDETVYDTSTDLTWSRCPVGMKLEDSICQGTPELFTFDEAKIIAKNSNLAGYNDWHLPSYKIEKLYAGKNASVRSNVRTAIPLKCMGEKTEATVTTESSFLDGSRAAPKSTQTQTIIRGEEKCDFWIKNGSIADVVEAYIGRDPSKADVINSDLINISKPRNHDLKRAVMLVRGKD